MVRLLIFILVTSSACIVPMHSFAQASKSVDEIADSYDLFSEVSYYEEAALLPIESILHNPAVLKKQQSKNTIQAIGVWNTSSKQFDIHFKKQQLHGNWQSFFANNQSCDSGRFVKNLPDGVWKTWYPDGTLKTLRTYSAQKYHYVRADLRRNHPKDQRFHITTYARQGKNVSKYFIPQYEKAMGILPNFTILQKIEHNTQTKVSGYIAPFKACLHHGLFINFFENGLVKDSGQYVNGLKHELWEELSADGNTRAFGFYAHGIRRGDWKYYDANNKLVYTEYFDISGRPTGRHYFKK